MFYVFLAGLALIPWDMVLARRDWPSNPIGSHWMWVTVVGLVVAGYALAWMVLDG